MTCIVGLEFGNTVILGGDVQGTGRNNKVVHTQPKVFVRGGVAFGYTTSYRFGQILEHNMQSPVIPADDAEIYRWLVTVVIPDIRAILVVNGYCDGKSGGTALLGIRDQLWELQDDFSVLRSRSGYSAVGSGNEYAKGSLATSLVKAPITRDEARDVVARAIQVAGTFSPSVGTESVIITT